MTSLDQLQILRCSVTCASVNKNRPRNNNASQFPAEGHVPRIQFPSKPECDSVQINNKHCVIFEGGSFFRLLMPSWCHLTQGKFCMKTKQVRCKRRDSEENDVSCPFYYFSTEVFHSQLTFFHCSTRIHKMFCHTRLIYRCEIDW